MNNFASFYTQSVKDKLKKKTKGKYRGQSNIRNKKTDLTIQGPVYNPHPARSDAPSASTFVSRG